MSVNLETSRHLSAFLARFPDRDALEAKAWRDCLCRREGGTVWAQPDCPAHGLFGKFDAGWRGRSYLEEAAETYGGGI